jgi:fatty acid desaturase
MKILRHKEDRRSIGVIAIYFLWAAATWILNPSSVWLKWIAIMPLCGISWIAAVITHNTLHSPIFVSKAFNRMFQIALSLAYGFPVSEYIPGHNLSHHQFTQTAKDVMRTSKVQFHVNFLNFFLFMPAVAYDVTKANMRFAKIMKKSHPEWFQQFMFEFVACWGIKLFLLYIDFNKCVYFIMIPHFFALWAITTINFLWHDGCDENSKYNHSRNFIGKTFNWFFFNNGFHGMHHMQPSLHWSKLPAAHHRVLRPYLHPALEQQSFFVYLFKSMIYPGRRVQFDGTAIQLLPRQPDADWIFFDKKTKNLQPT